MSGKAKPGERVQLAPPRYAEHAPTVWVIDGQAELDDDTWAVPCSAAEIVVVLGPCRGRERQAVLLALNLQGFWPERFALSAYLRGET